MSGDELLVTDGSVSHQPVRIQRLDADNSISDLVSAEEPLEIRLAYGAADAREEMTIAITMRTPGNDSDLALGFLFGEGVIAKSEDVLAVAPCGPPSPDKGLQNVLKVELAKHITFDQALLERHFYTTSSCGVCGKTSIEAVQTQIPAYDDSTNFQIAREVLQQVPEKLKAEQTEFAKTGGLHGAALFNQAGHILAVREDVGRHNAVDKLIGATVFAGKVSEPVGLILSGRASFELMQKAAMAGITFVAAVGPPSSLAVELAVEQDITLVGFLSESRGNVYHRADRVTA